MKFRTVVWDSPWPESGGGKIKRGADKHYRLIKSKEQIYEVIRESPLYSQRLLEVGEHGFRYSLNLEENAHGYCWVTNTYLKWGLWLLDMMGFEYKTNVIWNKNRPGDLAYRCRKCSRVIYGVQGQDESSQSSPGVLLQKEEKGGSQDPQASMRVVSPFLLGEKQEAEILRSDLLGQMEFAEHVDQEIKGDHKKEQGEIEGFAHSSSLQVQVHSASEASDGRTERLRRRASPGHVQASEAKSQKDGIGPSQGWGQVQQQDLESRADRLPDARATSSRSEGQMSRVSACVSCGGPSDLVRISSVSNKAGLGQYFRGKHELCLFGIRGKGMDPSVYTGDRTLQSSYDWDYGRDEKGKPVHSKKPDEFYDLVEKRSRGPYLELFARRPRNERWTCWGPDAGLEVPMLTDEEME